MEDITFKFLFKPLIDKMKGDKTLDPQTVMLGMEMYNRGFLRQMYGIRQLMVRKDNGVLTITAGLEDRKDLYLLKINLGVDSE